MIFSHFNHCSSVSDIKEGHTIAIWSAEDREADSVNRNITLVVIDEITESEDDILLHFKYQNDKVCMAWQKHWNGDSWVCKVWHLGKINLHGTGES